jgi:hypothetical protein
MTPTLFRLFSRLAFGATLTSIAASAADIVLTPPAGDGVSVTNAAGTTTHLRVAADGSSTFAGSLVLPASTPTAGNILKGSSRFLHNFGTSNTFLGLGAGNFTMTGGGNTAAGNQALSHNTTGTSNSALGDNALLANTEGQSNTAVGSEALLLSTTGDSNTAVGAHAGRNGGSVNHNTAIGAFALYSATGSTNVAIGYSAGFNLDSGSFNVHIANPGTAADTHTIRIGTHGTHARAFLGGVRGIATATADAVPVLIDSQGQLGTASASRQRGEHNAGPGPGGVAVYTITFPAPFVGAVPKVMVTPRMELFGGVEVNDTVMVTVRAVSTTQFKVNAYRVDAAGGSWSTDLKLVWSAWQ